MTRLAPFCLVTFALAGLSGCFSPDAVIRHPLQGPLQQNQITKQHGFAEHSHGLPPGALSDSASITEMTTTRTCFGAQLNELDPIDLSTAQSLLKISDGGELEFPQMWIDPPRSVTHQGVVPETYYAGTQTYCSYYGRYGCLAWATRPRYLTRMVPGPVTVHTSSGQMCFPTTGRITPKTRYVTLQLKVARLGTISTKELSFTWELLGPAR